MKRMQLVILISISLLSLIVVLIWGIIVARTDVWMPVDTVSANIKGVWVARYADGRQAHMKISEDGQAVVDGWPRYLGCYELGDEQPGKLTDLPAQAEVSFTGQINVSSVSSSFSLTGGAGSPCALNISFFIERSYVDRVSRVYCQVGRMDDDSLDERLIFYRSE